VRSPSAGSRPLLFDRRRLPLAFGVHVQGPADQQLVIAAGGLDQRPAGARRADALAALVPSGDELISLTAAESRRLFDRCTGVIRAASHHERWSRWRRRHHQARARTRRRLRTQLRRAFPRKRGPHLPLVLACGSRTAAPGSNVNMDPG
jgi:hypothetical protein